MGVIENKEVLSTTQLRADALAILEAGYESVMTERVIESEINVREEEMIIQGKTFRFADYEKIYFVAIGKCAVDAANAFEKKLGSRIADGVVIDVKEGSFSRLRSYVGTHPFPSEQNVEATKEIVSLLSAATEHDLVLAVISGGGSALLSLPHNLSCADVQRLTKVLWKGGATISEVNTVRKHISDIHGGYLAQHAYPATVVSFIFSDVPGDDISMIASGPTVRDQTTINDARSILEKYNALSTLPSSDQALVETPKDDTIFARVTNILLVTNKRALSAMKDKAGALGYHADIITSTLQGIASLAGQNIVSSPVLAHSCALYAGETTVTITGNGKGGRNQEFVLGAVKTIPQGMVVVAASSDGWDNTDVAGAIGDAGDRERAQTLGLSIDEYLRSNDSYHFWSQVGGAIKTGRTGINVADFYFVLKE